MRKHNEDLSKLEEKLGVTFKNKATLVNALVHSSYVNENPASTSNERLEFLGDAYWDSLSPKNSTKPCPTPSRAS